MAKGLRGRGFARLGRGAFTSENRVHPALRLVCRGGIVDRGTGHEADCRDVRLEGVVRV